MSARVVASTIVGAVIGFYIGGPAGAVRGAAWGYTLGSAAFPPDGPTITGPRVDDLRVQSTAIGAPVPWGWGTFCLSGNVIWSSGLIETKHKDKVGGKGSGGASKQVSYTYAVNMAIGLCKGVVYGTYPIRRIWANGIPVFDLRDQQPDETDEQYAERAAATAEFAENMFVYNGTETQTADPTIESFLGVGNVPGYRGLVYVVFRDFELIDYGNRPPNFRFEIQRIPSEGTGDVDSLAAIIKEISNACGIADEEMDLTDLEDMTPTGYLVGSVTDGRGAIQPLMSWGYFDVVESAEKLRYVTRGQAAVATLTTDDLGAHTSGEERPSVMTVERANDVELPKRLRVTYVSPEQEYDSGMQSATRLTTSAVNVVDIQLPICMTADEAAQHAEVLLFDAWTSRMSYRFALDYSWARLEPGDCINVPVDDTLQRMRVVSTDLSLVSTINVLAIRDDAGGYTSTATGNSPFLPASAFQYAGPSEMLLLDLPALSDPVLDDAGYYVAVRGTGGAWKGATVYASPDGGSTYEGVAEATASALIGTVEYNVGAGITTTWDNVNTITVRVPEGASAGFENRTEEGLYAGGNTAVIGVDGRWEVFQFLTATNDETDAELWHLTGLLRGRRGTERYVATTIAGDSFALLSEGGVERIDRTVGQLGQSRLHKVITYGKPLDSYTPVDFAGDGESLKPFSPVYLEAERTGGDIILTWIRRDRLARELISGADLPLSESYEGYYVEILDGVTVKRAYETTTTTVTYTAAEQTTDWGGSAPDPVSVRVRQKSGTFGYEIAIPLEASA